MALYLSFLARRVVPAAQPLLRRRGRQGQFPQGGVIAVILVHSRDRAPPDATLGAGNDEI